MNYPFVSVIIPCRNEEDFIRIILENLEEQDYPKNQWEVFIVDGRSDDRTAQIITEYLQGRQWLTLLDNPLKIVPAALNLAIRQSKGDIIIRMNAHAQYPENYISMLVKNLNELNADNVGGVWITVPGADTVMAKAIAIATASIFGVGNADYRTGSKNIKQVDTVPFGCYPRHVFDRIGLFDTDLVRTEDDEFNARLLKNGGKIFLIPSIKIKSFARSTLSKISKMFYQYALFKPLANVKIGFPATWRQLVPLFLLASLIVSGILGLLFKNLSWCFFLIAGSYLAGVFAVSFLLSLKHKGMLFPYLLVIFPSIHFSYAFGYAWGIWKFVILKKRYADFEMSR
jgi:glycosyltransferase involved in cell wall biosynthesis